MTIGVASLHVLVTLEWTFSLSVDRPEGKPFNRNPLHLDRYILSMELDSLDPTGEFYDSLEGKHELFEAYSSLLKLSVPDNQKPLVGKRTLEPCV